MVTLVVPVFVDVNPVIAIFVFIFVYLFLVALRLIIRLQSSLCSEAFGAEARLGRTHLVKLLRATVILFFEDFFLLLLLMLVLQLVNHLLLLLASLAVFKVVQV